MILNFPTEQVKDLFLHAINGKEHFMGLAGGTPTPGLILVKDHGVYLMSNAKREKNPDGSWTSNVLFAKGCDPSKDEDWYDKALGLGGDDFGEVFTFPKEQHEAILRDLDRYKTVFFKVTSRSISMGFKTPKK